MKDVGSYFRALEANLNYTKKHYLCYKFYKVRFFVLAKGLLKEFSVVSYCYCLMQKMLFALLLLYYRLYFQVELIRGRLDKIVPNTLKWIIDLKARTPPYPENKWQFS